MRREFSLYEKRGRSMYWALTATFCAILAGVLIRSYFIIALEAVMGLFVVAVNWRVDVAMKKALKDGE
jgi:hypothetical protein